MHRFPHVRPVVLTTSDRLSDAWRAVRGKRQGDRSVSTGIADAVLSVMHDEGTFSPLVKPVIASTDFKAKAA